MGDTGVVLELQKLAQSHRLQSLNILEPDVQSGDQWRPMTLPVSDHDSMTDVKNTQLPEGPRTPNAHPVNRCCPHLVMMAHWFVAVTLALLPSVAVGGACTPPESCPKLSDGLYCPVAWRREPAIWRASDCRGGEVVTM